MICVYHARDFGEADIVAAWLAEQGLTVHVKDRLSAGIYGPLVVAPRGIQVCVLDQTSADRAKELLAQREAQTPAASQPSAAGPDVEVDCEDCGRTSHFPASEQGSVQSCPHCRAFVDV
jgi:hypothetical protein